MSGEAADTAQVRDFTRLGTLVALTCLIADQMHKWYMLEVVRITLNDTIRVTPFLNWVYVRNTGISYGWLPLESQTGQYILAAFAVLASIALAIWLTRAQSRPLAISLGLIIGGALGNAIDRVRLGGVADFFSLHAFGYHWYIFNIADVAIVAGVLALLYDAFSQSRISAANTD